uniref:S phase cyclin A-associated protein in the endoplasmic reticulum N-terminal domain-containing protein n=1 Tax=Anopheles atroparvus TaxID=41427 RepID=A0AAG5DT33_ANOAO
MNTARADGKEPVPHSTEAISVVYDCLTMETYVLKLDQYTQTNLEDENLTLAEYLNKYSNQNGTGNRVEGEMVTEEEVKKDAITVDAPSSTDRVEEKKPSVGSDSRGEQLGRRCPMKNAAGTNVTKPPASVRGTLQTKVTVAPKTVGVRGPGARPPGPAGIVRKSATTSSVSHSNVKPMANFPTKSATVSSMHLARNRNGIKQPYASKVVLPSGSLGASDPVASRLAVRSKTMIEVTSVGRMKNLATDDPRRRSTVKLTLAGNLSKEDVYSSSSTLKASTDRLGSRNSISSSSTTRATGTTKLPPASTQAKAAAIARRSEPKSMPSSSDANDGWYTVKTKRRSSLLWATRFNQPSGYASLPTLALLDENSNSAQADGEAGEGRPQKETSKTVESESESNHPHRTQQQRTVEKPAKPSSQTKATLSKANGTSTVATKISQPVKSLRGAAVETGPKNRQPTAPVSRLCDSRQKSDLTGLKLKTLHKEFLRSEKLKSKTTTDLPQGNANGTTDNGQVEHAEVKSVVSSSVQDDDSFTQFNMVDMNIQTNLGTTAIENLYASCLQETSEGIQQSLRSSVELPSQCTSDDQEEQERDDIESDEDQRKLLEEQESLEAQIRELENTEIDIDTETDETDCEAIIDFEDTDGTVESGTDRPSDNIGDPIGDEEDITLEMRYEAVLAEMNWVERARTLDTLKALVARHPGRAQQLHAKLSSPSRRRSLHETLKKYQAKQARALEKRQALQKEKSLKIQQLLARVEDVKAAKQCLIEKKRLRMEERLQRAAENRTQYLKDKIKKAHDEEEKLKEIAFIKNLEAQNKRLDFMESWKEQEVRLQDLETERQKKAEEKAAKEAAVERRRQEIEQERQKKLQQMSENRREREKRVGKMQEQKERQRQALAREKARDREERLLALQAQKQATTEELQRKIIQKQQESARRHEENIEQIRQRAVELATIPSRSVDELRNDEQDEENSSVSERDSVSGGNGACGESMPKINKKRVKKLRQKLAAAAEEYLAEQSPLAPSIRKQSQVPRLLNTVSKGGSGTLGVERPIGQLLRLIAKAEVADFQSLWLLDGLSTIASVIETGLSPGTDISKKAVVLSVQLYRNACTLCPQIARHAVLGNSIVVLLNALLLTLQSPEEKNPLFPVDLSTELILACTVALLPTSPSLKQTTHPKVAERLPDVLSYIISIGLVDILVRRINGVHEAIENQASLVLSLLASLGLLTNLIEICPKGPDVTKLVQTAQNTELFGTVSLLYAAIVPVGESIPPRTTSLAAATFNLMVTFANLDIEAFQAVLTERNLSLRFLDVISILLQYCVPKADIKSETQTVIIDLIATLGFFCANNKPNQDLLTSDQYTYVIKSFAKLPKQFDVITYPTLVTIIHENPSARSVVARDFSVELLDEFKSSDMAKKNRIVSLLV